MKRNILQLIFLFPSLFFAFQLAQAQQQNINYVYDGTTLEPKFDDFTRANPTHWQIWLYQEPLHIPHYTAGLPYSRWGLIEGRSAESVIKQLRASQSFEEAYLNFFGPGTWGRYTFFNPLGPIAIVDQAIQKEPSAELYQLSELNYRLNRLITAVQPSLENNEREGPSSPVKEYFDQIRDSLDALSRRTQMTRPNSVTTNYTYDNLSRVLSVLHQLSGSTIDGASYTVDAAGNRTAKTNQAAGVTSNYTYDAIYQLTQVMQGTNTTESYSYNPVGNRLASLGVSPYAYNAANELTSTPNATYTYDNNGNTVSKTDSTGTTSYTWDFENRLTSATLPGASGTVSFKYDPLWRRIRLVSSVGTSIYAYDGPALVEETDATGTAVARYAQASNIDEPLAMRRGGATSYYHTDALGSVTSLSNSAGAVAQTYTYDSFGNLVNSSGSTGNPFSYAAREFDVLTGLSYNRARYYDQRVGRFISEDPIQFSGGLNFYRYVYNNPIMATDPLGLFCTPDFVLHYYSWSGTTIDLGAVGLLNGFEQSSSVRGSVQTFKLMVSSTARSKARSLCKNCDDGIKHTTFSDNSRDTTDVTHEPCLFSVGHSTFFRYAGCSLAVDCKNRTYSFSCGLSFSIRDWFQDPLDLGIEVGGVPYMITAGWSESFSGTGRF